jgi:hypothetical protein
MRGQVNLHRLDAGSNALEVLPGGSQLIVFGGDDQVKPLSANGLASS